MAPSSDRCTAFPRWPPHLGAGRRPEAGAPPTSGAQHKVVEIPDRCEKIPLGLLEVRSRYSSNSNARTPAISTTQIAYAVERDVNKANVSFL